MSYSVDTRELVIRYLNNGHTEEEAKKEFGISVPSMTKWRRMLRETGSLEDRKPERKPRKLHDEELKAYIAVNPDAQFIEIAAHFGCSDEGVRKACKRLGITRKKKTRLYKERDEVKRQEFLAELEDIPPQ
jgi:transposase